MAREDCATRRARTAPTREPAKLLVASVSPLWGFWSKSLLGPQTAFMHTDLSGHLCGPMGVTDPWRECRNGKQASHPRAITVCKWSELDNARAAPYKRVCVSHDSLTQ
jgi:hypothetical protein